MDTRFADTAFGRIEYLDRGQGPPVLVLHGTPGGHDQGSLMADSVVAAGLRAIIPSRPGYLGSELTELNRSFDGAADALAALMAGLGIDAYSVLCWSGGGPTAFRLALRHGERVHALVALAAASQRYDWHPDGGERFMFGTALGNWILKIMAEHAPRQLIGATLASEGELSKEDLETLVRQVWSDETKRRFVVELAATVSWRGARKPGLDNDMACFAAIDDLQLEHIQVPTLLVHGRADTDCPPQHSEAAARRIPGARLRWIERGGHLAMFTDPDSDAVQADIVGFLRQP
jgi:pimeloyl-ACP methyl ester carboxylesterase